MNNRIITCFIILSLIVTGCRNTGKSKNEKTTITVSIEPQRYFVEQIAGDKIDVKTLVPQGAKPETYDMTPAQLVQLSKSQAYFMMGFIGFERSWVNKYSDEHPHTNIINMSEGIKPIVTDHDMCGDGIETYGNEFIEPHTWMSVKNARLIYKNVLHGLILIDHENRDYYINRYDSIMEDLKEFDNNINIALQKADTAFMIYHPALTYFANDYDLTQISIENEGKEPSPKELSNIIKDSKKMGISIIFIQPEFDPRNAKTIAEETNSKLVTFNPLSYDWKNEIMKVVNALSHNNSTK